MELIAITNRKLCQGDFLKQIEKLSKSGVSGIVLREKDLDDAQYEDLLRKCLSVLKDSPVPLYVNQKVDVAKKLSHPFVQVSYSDFLKNPEKMKDFKRVLVSVHAAEEAKNAQKLGADGVIAGHIFVTDCKKGLPPRGIPFLQSVLDQVSIPVYAIGGITKETLPKLLGMAIQGACVMSASMAETFFWNTIDNRAFRD